MRFLLAFLVPAFFIVSCVDGSREVTVTVEAGDFIPGIVEDVMYECDGKIIDNPELVWDPNAAEYRQVWDTSATGEYSVTVTTVFGEQTVQKFDVKSDTTLHVENRLPYQSVEFIPKETMLQADTVQFVRVAVGCFHEDHSRITLVKNQDGYEMTEQGGPYFDQAWRQISNDDGLRVIDSFIQSENEIEQLRFDRAGEGMGSTSRQYVFLRADKEVYAYFDEGAKWVSYPHVYIP